MDTNKHKFFMLQLLKDLFSDALLSSVLAFKGGTATMFFYDLPRFSTDLDFNLLNPEQEKEGSAHLRQGDNRGHDAACVCFCIRPAGA